MTVRPDVELARLAVRVRRLEQLYEHAEPVMPLVVKPGNPWIVEDQCGRVMGTLDLVWLANRPYEQGWGPYNCLPACGEGSGGWPAGDAGDLP